MERMLRRFSLFIFVVGTGFVWSQAHGLAPTVQDEAGFFGKDAIRQANQIVGRIYQRTGKQVAVQTMDALPVKPAEKDGENEAKLVASHLFKEEKLNGMLILWVRSPKILLFHVGDQTKGQFPLLGAIRQDMRRQLKAASHPEPTQADFDAALLNGLHQIEQLFVAPRSQGSTHSYGASADYARRVEADVPTSSRRGLSWGIVLLLGGAAVVIWLIVRSRRSGPVAVGPGGMTPGGGMMGGPTYYGGGSPGGSSWVGPALGGVAGAMAGNWLYDRMAHGDGHAHADTPHSSPVSSDSDWLPSDNGVSGTTYGGEGGDWGGGDSGGDSSSGGDW